MRQVAQNLRSGEIAVADVPAPALRGPGVLIATSYSVLSPGTERAAVELGRSSLLGKALRRPDQVRKVLDTLRREGVAATLRKVRDRLDVDRPLGYSAAGIVLESLDAPFAPGDRVACAGTDAATHAEINFVPRNLCARVPQGVPLDEAAFAALGAIALHGLRLGEVALGQDVAVVGLGMVGLLLAQALRAAGCRVTGFDLRADRLAAAARLGVDRIAVASPEALAGSPQDMPGFDRVFLCAASRSAEPVEFAVLAARDRARIVVVGDVRTDFPRNACYEKELSIVYARSYGPGRYDPAYEEQGHDYPRAYVPWTAQRNLESFLHLLATRRMAVAPLISHRLPIAEAARAYEIVAGGEPSLGVVIEYPVVESARPSSIELRPREPRRPGTLGIGWIGAGSYAVTSLLPHLAADHRIHMLQVSNARGLSAKRVADQFAFASCTTDPGVVLADAGCDAVFIATRHALHARLVAAALQAGKSVYVEKPLCISQDELAIVEDAWARDSLPLVVGFNRRWAPATSALREFFAADSREPFSIRYTVRAGVLPPSHWLSDPAEGGRIAGEVCHFVDWCLFLSAAPVDRVFAGLRGRAPAQSLHATLEFSGGSQASVIYEQSPAHGLPKERIEISRGGRIAILEDFRVVTFHSPEGRRRRLFHGKGQAEMIAAVVSAFLSGTTPHPVAGAFDSTRATLKLLESASCGLPLPLDSAR
ncbi:MAG TPA: bi-domain-containing oxidoreductase [Candidatus Acidoferrales bacterium]|nr:bi-domain-containing oxidoreductase [Candidatus Acidoferrales bacterium]